MTELGNFTEDSKAKIWDAKRLEITPRVLLTWGERPQAIIFSLKFQRSESYLVHICQGWWTKYAPLPDIFVILTQLKPAHWFTVKSSSDLTVFLQAIGEQPSARVVNAIEAPLSKYIHVGAILFKKIESVLHRLSTDIHGGFVKAKPDKVTMKCALFMLFCVFTLKF